MNSKRVDTRSLREILDQTNALARELYRLHGYIVPEGSRFDLASFPEEKIIWEEACVAQFVLTGVDVKKEVVEKLYPKIFVASNDDF